MERPTLSPASQSTVHQRVEPTDLASGLRPEVADLFPPVFATAHMVALMERAAAEAMRPLLQPGECSVGVKVDVSHDAPTPEGEEVSATATFLCMEGKLYRFQVVAADAGGPIGQGTHLRAIVALERLVSGAQRRRPAILS